MKFNLQRSTIKAPFALKTILLPDATPPVKLFREYKVPAGQWGMLGNNTVGDCIVAMIGHWLMCITEHTGTMYIPTVEEILAAYTTITGYDPSQTDAQGNNPTDTGTTIAAIMQFMMTTGIGGIKILAWADVDITSIAEQKLGMYGFGGILDAASLPQSAVDQFNAGTTWAPVDPDGGIVGGHGFPNFGYGFTGTTGVTWAKLQQMLWTWRLKYLMESAVAITPAWLKNADGLAPNMMNLDALNALLKTI